MNPKTVLCLLSVIALAMLTVIAGEVPDNAPTFDPTGTWYVYNDQGQRYVCTIILTDPNHMSISGDGLNSMVGTPFVAMSDIRGTGVRVGKNEWRWSQLIQFRTAWDPDMPWPEEQVPTMGWASGTLVQSSPDRMDGQWTMGIYGLSAPSFTLPWDGATPDLCLPGAMTLIRMPIGEGCAVPGHRPDRRLLTK